MASVAAVAAMNGDAARTVHPFFKPNEIHDNSALPHDAQDTESVGPAPADQQGEQDAMQGRPAKAKRSRKVKDSAQSAAGGKTQKTLQDILKPTVAAPLSDKAMSDRPKASDEASCDPMIEVSRRKRQRTSQYESVDVGAEDEVMAHIEETRPPSPRVVIAASSPLPESDLQIEVPQAGLPTTPPKKMLRLSGNGKFSSPVSKKTPGDEYQPSPETVKRRGRPPRSRVKDAPKQLFIRMKYSTNVGERIARILSGEEQIKQDKKHSPQKMRTPKKPARSTHPFFLEKPKDPPLPKHESPRKTSATTPGKLKTQIFGDRLPTVKEVPYTVGSALLKDRLLTKQPGAREAPWPSRDQVHVRGLFRQDLKKRASETLLLSARKRKHARLTLQPEESILRHFASNLVPEEDTRVRMDGYHEPHGSLRLAGRLLISGQELQERLRRSLSSFAEHSIQHPAIAKLWRALPGTLSAFDEGTGENLAWTQKYAPEAAEELLQAGKEMKVLREWLLSLTVIAVETSTKAVAKPTVKTEVKPRKKKRRKPDDLDDFLIDSDEEIHNMDVLFEPQDVAPGTNAKTQHSLIQMTGSDAKLSNAVLLSGPHGCGKTAAAYAVAKELGFKVFDISACERRSGKDVLDKVGDMTENHLVKHHGMDASELSSTEEPNRARMEEAFRRDLESGRQGKMASFFKPKANAVKVPAQQKKSTKAKTIAAVEKAIRKPAKEQQQSLILLEEVDILFKDDREFWTTVLRLIITSKRPFIMTCNDEDLVPLQVMNLHAILRFTPPASKLATDYMLLVAASEGHLLNEQVVASLYQEKHSDLRASLTELNFWCQMGIGDPKSGLSWIYQRWPPGSDLDETGRKLRTVSQGTYLPGMGLVPEPVSCEEDEGMIYAWNYSGITPLESLAHDYNWSLVEARTGVDDIEHGRRMDALKRYARLTECLSAVDVFVKPGLPDTAPLQTSQPPMPDKARSHYIEGLPLLQTDEHIDYHGVSAQLANDCALAAQHAYPKTDDPSEDASAFSLTSLEQAHLKSYRLQPLKRQDFAAFDPISTPSETTLSSAGTIGLLQSAFDGPLSIITTDLAPYVRMIVRYDLALEEQRERLSDVMAEGRTAKKARTTRAARSALEGSQRSSTRRERWFTKALDLPAVLATGGKSWPKSGVSAPTEDAESEPASSETS